ncbi:hypothetical protein MKW98_028350 [Papaver atlanticum]|uniref:Cystatin domain-containing protein n=1 Tax=Papaver atlanticum TaxID=357466 RepID=A0AAD4XKF6_9MAGN|nr:hypothetical protein MKW98_028350 [Papaver atlanticum]
MASPLSYSSSYGNAFDENQPSGTRYKFQRRVLDENQPSGTRYEIKYLFFHRHVQELGKYAVAEYSLKFKEGEKGTLTLKKVVKAQQQDVAGTNYFLKISAIQNGKPQLFDVFVHVNLNREKSVVSFDPSFD